jgi:hypothetical protein
MRAVYKYAAPLIDAFHVEMPVGAEVLCVQMQGGAPQIWAMVDPGPGWPVEYRWFRWRGTGHPADGVGRYVGTVQVLSTAFERPSSIPLVFHLFEEPVPK